MGVRDHLRVEFINMKNGCRLGNPFNVKIPGPGDTTTTEFRQQDNEIRLDLTWIVAKSE